MNVIKRNGEIIKFNGKKIRQAVLKAFVEVDGKITEDAKLKTHEIVYCVKMKNKTLSVEEIQDIVEKELMKIREDVARAYIRFRYKREICRNSLDETVLEIINGKNEYWSGENSNKNPRLNTTIRDYMAGAISTDMTRRLLLPDDIIKAHDQGIIHFHDMDYFAQSGMYNCCLVNLEDMLQNGTVISETKIDKPHSFSTACTVATQIIAQVASSQYGGQSISLAHLAPFVDVSRQAIKEEVENELEDVNIEDKVYLIDKIVKSRLKKEIQKGIQTIQYQIITLMTTNGQAPFVTIFMYLNEAKSEQEKEDLALLIEETLKQSILGVKNEEGTYITPAFPKLIYVLQEDNITENSKYWYLTELAAKCSVKRLSPDYISEKVMKEIKEDNCFPVMGCRSALSPWKDENGDYKFYGRFNKGVVTINLVDIALSSGGDFKKFWEIFEERMDICHRALLCRYERLKGVSTDVAPILWRHGATSRLSNNETFDNLLIGGYSTISLGYAGLYECVKYMTGHSHSDEGVGEKFGLKVMKEMNKKCDEWNDELYLGYGLYGTPIESTTYKFAKMLKKRFGEDVFKNIDGNDRNYITNSYHIPVFEKIDAFEKLRIEAKFQKLSTGGNISYVEAPNLNDNIPAVLEIIKFIYHNNMYAEINTKSDYCQKCKYDKEIELIDENGKLIWKCPSCGNTDTRTMDITRRTCGYKGTARNGWNQGRLDEMKNRFVHLDDIESSDL